MKERAAVVSFSDERRRDGSTATTTKSFPGHVQLSRRWKKPAARRIGSPTSRLSFPVGDARFYPTTILSRLVILSSRRFPSTKLLYVQTTFPPIVASCTNSGEGTALSCNLIYIYIYIYIVSHTFKRVNPCRRISTIFEMSFDDELFQIGSPFSRPFYFLLPFVPLKKDERIN